MTTTQASISTGQSVGAIILSLKEADYNTCLISQSKFPPTNGTLAMTHTIKTTEMLLWKIIVWHKTAAQSRHSERQHFHHGGKSVRNLVSIILSERANLTGSDTLHIAR